jgi:hypothetical protein
VDCINKGFEYTDAMCYAWYVVSFHPKLDMTSIEFRLDMPSVSITYWPGVPEAVDIPVGVSSG